MNVLQINANLSDGKLWFFSAWALDNKYEFINLGCDVYADFIERTAIIIYLTTISSIEKVSYFLDS